MSKVDAERARFAGTFYGTLFMASAVTTLSSVLIVMTALL